MNEPITLHKLLATWKNGNRSDVWKAFKDMNPYEKGHFLDGVEDHPDAAKIYKYLILKLIP